MREVRSRKGARFRPFADTFANTCDSQERFTEIRAFRAMIARYYLVNTLVRDGRNPTKSRNVLRDGGTSFRICCTTMNIRGSLQAVDDLRDHRTFPVNGHTENALITAHARRRAHYKHDFLSFSLPLSFSLFSGNYFRKPVICNRTNRRNCLILLTL